MAVAVVIASMVRTQKCEAGKTFGRRDHTANNIGRAPSSQLERKMQSWLIRNGSQSKISATMRHRTKHSTKNSIYRTTKRGSFMTSQIPTKRRVYRWFGLEGEDPNQFVRCMMLRNEFNHNICGITNPFLKFVTSKPHQEIHTNDATDTSSFVDLSNNNRKTSRRFSQLIEGACNGNTRCYEKTVLASRTKNEHATVSLGSSPDVEDSWWPSLQIVNNNAFEQNGIRKTNNKWDFFGGKNKNINDDDYSILKDKWRIRTYRKRVGKGKSCYEKVRDAALDWEFQSSDGSTGMIQVADNCPSTDDLVPINSSGRSRSYSVQPTNDDESRPTNKPSAYSSSSSLYRSLGSRRLVSFASKSITGFLPSFLQHRIYSINPVMVVYDVVDQRAPNGKTTFTSTAYATLKGHFLSGEERVTVALRDGSQDVEVEILSISRAGPGLFGKTLWPFIGKMQSDFFHQQLDHLSQSGLTIDGKNAGESGIVKSLRNADDISQHN